jgi:hypothetical protein
MRSLVVRRGIHGATLAVAAICAAGASAADPVGFNRDVRPILADVCWKCHGQGKQQAGLRLDRRESALAETESGSVPIVPGQPEQSELVRRIFSTDPDETMPPPNSHKTLTAEQQEILRRWVAEGAAYEGHWSFQTPRKPPVPVVLGTDYRIYNPIDSFIAERLRHEGLAMSAEADRPTLIRRVAFALTGLAPTPAEVDAYLADAAPQAYEQMVERYLASPHFGEEMARHWLDVARYADTHGLHLDNERQTWAYRDWVIAAFNRNLPFDQFTIDQLAGDLVPGG